jgi:hypothetical protein
MSLENFGKLKIAKRDRQSNEKETFIETVVLLEHCWLKTNFLHEEVKIDLWNYEENYYKVIENLIFMKYSEDIANLILWYVYDRFDADGKLLGLDVTFPGKEKKRFLLKSPIDLWNLIEKINKSNSKEK